MIGVLTLLTGLASAQEIPELLADLPEPPVAVIGCHDLHAAFEWFGADELGMARLDQLQLPPDLNTPEQAAELGLDPAGAMLVVFTAEAEHALVRLPVADEARFRAALLPTLVDGATPVPGTPDSWRNADGSPLALALHEGAADLRLGHWSRVAPPSDTLPRLVARLDDSLGGCWGAVDLVALDAASAQDVSAEAALFQGTLDGSHYEVVVTGVDLPADVQGTMTGGEAPRAPLGTGLGVQDLVVRVNGDALEALAAVQQISLLLGQGLPPVVGTGGALLEQSSLEIVPGVELALGGLMGTGVPTATVVLPIARPRARRRLTRMVTQAFEDAGLTPARLGDAWSLDGVGGMDGWWLGVTRGALVIGLSAPGVQEVLDGAGEPWVPVVDRALASEPGVWMRGDLTRLPLGFPLVATAHLGSPAPGEISLVLDAPGLMGLMDEQLPDLVEQRSPGTSRTAPISPDADPVGSPPSTEALAVLMLIGSAQESAWAETGTYTPYEGGPRAVEDLDGEAVPWDGIPGLGMTPMDTICRYEVRVDHEGWLATAWCDQDADGEAAAILLRPGGTPITVSPPGVR